MTQEPQRNTTAEFVQQWVHTTHPVDATQVDFHFLPSPDADNWMEAAILNAQKGLPALHLQAVFGLCVPTRANVGSGDVICDQYLRAGRVRALWVHDEPFMWTDGGDPSLDPAAADDFVTDWLPRQDRLERVEHKLSQDPSATIESLAESDRNLAEELLRAHGALCAVPGGRVPDIIGARVINSLLQRLLPEGARFEPGSAVGSLTGATWIVRNLVGRVDLPDAGRQAELRDLIDRMLDGPTKFGPSTTLRVLWTAYFVQHRLEQVLVACRGHAWRVIADAAKLIERLAVDPQVGDVRLVRCSEHQAHADQLAEREAAAKAAREAAERSALEAEQSQLASGRVMLRALRTMPAETYGLKLLRQPYLPEGHKALFRRAETAFKPTQVLGGKEWVGTTTTGRWVGARVQPGEPASYRLLSGTEDELAEVAGLAGDGEFFMPHRWFATGDFIYGLTGSNLGGKTLHEVDLRRRSHRVLMSSDDSSQPVLRSQPVSFAVFEGGLCSVDKDSEGGVLRLCRYEPGGTLETEFSSRLPCAGVYYDTGTRALLVMTAKHGLWVCRLVAERWVVEQCVPFEPKMGPFGNDRLVETTDGLCVQSVGRQFEVLNLENARSEASLPLEELCAAPTRASELAG